MLSAGVGSDLVFKNLATGTTYAVRGNGAVGWTGTDVSGSTRITLTGHNVVFYFRQTFRPGRRRHLEWAGNTSPLMREEISLASP